MAIKYNSNMTVVQVLEGTKKDILDNLDLLAEDFFEKTGRKLNKGCSACVIEAVLTLKNLYKMTQFKFKRQRGCYKNKKGDKTTISNSTMTDVKAVEFLKTNPKRIELFSEYPSNWKDLIAGKAETEEMKKIRIAIEAEQEAAKEAAEKKAKKGNQKPSELKKQAKEEAEKLEEARKEAQAKLDGFVSGAEGCASEEEVLEAVGKLPEIERGVYLQSLKEKKANSEGSDETGSDDDNSDNGGSGDGDKPSREELLKTPLKELRKLYPDVKATSIEAFADKVLAD